MNTPRILITDDDALSREIVALVLRDAGYEATLAADGEQALAQLARTQPAVVLVDCELPEIDGKAVPSYIHHVAPNVPVILLTAHTELGAKREAKRLGATDYINKPINLDDLLFRVANVLTAHYEGEEYKAGSRQLFP